MLPFIYYHFTNSSQLYHYRLLVPVLELFMNRIIQYAPICVCFFSSSQQYVCGCSSSIPIDTDTGRGRGIE